MANMVIEWAQTLRRLRRASHGELARVSRETGVAYSNVWRIANGHTRAPRISTVQKIARYYAKPAA